MPATHYRAFLNKARIATAVLYKERILQVYPERTEFADLTAWRATMPAGTTYKAYNGNTVVSPPVADAYEQARASQPRAYERQQAELGEFFSPDPSLAPLFTSTTRISPSAVQVELADGSTWIVDRDLNFFAPPKVTRNGKPFPAYEWSPALTAVNWLLTLAYTDHPGDAMVVPAVAETAASARSRFEKIESTTRPVVVAQT